MRWPAILAMLLLVAAACGRDRGAADVQRQVHASSKEQLGQLLFEDPGLSEPAGQACADCHVLATGFADPEGDRTSMGVIKGRFGTRNAQPAMYARFTPPLHQDRATGRMVGGLFWDGRASSLEEQAAQPLLNPLEMNNPDKATVVRKVRARYAAAFDALFGPKALDDVERGYAHINEAIAAFERTPVFSPFSSRYDRYLAGTGTLSERELHGLALFEDPSKGNCASCHPNRPGPDGTPPLFTTFAYENLGLPRFRDNPFYLLPSDLNPDGEAFIDRGLATTTKDPRHAGMFRIPTLRNIAVTSPYGHNGYFRRLDEMVEFMVHKETLDPPPEVAETITRERLARTTLSRDDVRDLVAFLATLTDAEVERAPRPVP